MLINYAYIALFIILAVITSVGMLAIPFILRFLKLVPHKPNPVKNSIFECGLETIGKAWVRFNFRYYFFALMFVALDVMVVFIYPWAVGIRQFGYLGVIAIAIFIVIIAVGYIYAWKKRVLEWK